jgi:predicted RNA-binding Zn ribbon-like protein
MRAKFQLFADHAALDFVNTLDNRFLSGGTIELLHSYDDLLDFALQSRLLDARQSKTLKVKASDSAAKRVLGSALQVREALASVFYGSIDASIKIAARALPTLQRQFSIALRQRNLIRSRSSRSERNPHAAWTWNFPEPRLELPVWLITESAIALLTSSAMQQVHACASARCRWLFLDSSKNHSRRWCNMSLCGNRMKARRFHARNTAK